MYNNLLPQQQKTNTLLHTLLRLPISPNRFLCDTYCPSLYYVICSLSYQSRFSREGLIAMQFMSTNRSLHQCFL